MKRSLTAQCLVGLMIGVALGIALPRWYPDAVGPGLEGADGAIRVWTNALRLVVTPLIVAHLFLAISASAIGKSEAAKLGLVVPVVFIGLLAFAALCAVLATSGLLASPLLRDLPLDLGPGRPASVPAGGNGGPGGTPNWIDDLIPPNLVAAAARPEAILGLMLFALVFALASRRLSPELQKPLHTGVQAARDTLFILIGWLLRVAPILLLALGFRSALSSGLRVGQFLLAELGVEVTVLLLCTAALYLVAVIGGRVSLGLFARAAFPAQAAAAATRSSLATVPILLRDSQTKLHIPESISALVIPLAGATFKLSPVVNYPVKLLFLAYFLGIPLGLGQIVVFALTILLLSPATTGLPSVIPGSKSLPAFVAAGVSPEFVLLLGATRAISDVFLTVLNSTGYLTATVLVSRVTTRRALPARAPSVAAEPAVPPPGSQPPGLGLGR